MKAWLGDLGAPKQDPEGAMLGFSQNHVVAEQDHCEVQIVIFQVLKRSVDLSRIWNQLFNDFEARARWRDRYFVL